MDARWNVWLDTWTLSKEAMLTSFFQQRQMALVFTVLVEIYMNTMPHVFWMWIFFSYHLEEMSP